LQEGEREFKRDRNRLSFIFAIEKSGRESKREKSMFFLYFLLQEGKRESKQETQRLSFIHPIAIPIGPY
jgi:hypothetical protein